MTAGREAYEPGGREWIARPLALYGSHNTRDLGGYPAQEGGVIQAHRFVRSDAIQRWSAQDIAAMRAYGLQTIVDLRSGYEREKAPDPVIEGVRAIHAPMLDNMHSSGFAQNVPNRMSELYLALLENDGQTLCEVMRALLLPGCALFHCTAGKDRTGVVSMLLLKLAGVSDERVVRDYAVTAQYMQQTFAAQRAQLQPLGYAVPENAFDSQPDEMQRTLDFVAQRYGGAKSYLLQAGLEEQACRELQAKLLQVYRKRPRRYGTKRGGGQSAPPFFHARGG